MKDRAATRSAPLPTKPRLAGLVSLRFAGSGQARSRQINSGQSPAGRALTGEGKDRACRSREARFEPTAGRLRLTEWRIADRWIRCRSPGIEGAAPGTETGRGYHDFLANW